MSLAMSLHHRYPPPAPALHVSTSVQFDPNEPTARPGNAHLHAQFHHQIAAGLLKHDNGLSRALTAVEQERLDHLDKLKFFLATAPSRWEAGSEALDPNYHPIPTSSYHPHHPPAPPCMNRFLLPNQEYVSCVLWNSLYHITGTDIVRALVFRFEAFGRPVRNMKKFEEGVFSDLRNLKPGVDASLEEPKSPFLDLLFKYQAIRTQKKQKVFYWFSVPHDRLFLDALERDLKREKMGLEATTVVVGEPAQSFRYDTKRGLYEQFCKPARESDADCDSDGESDDDGDQADSTMEDDEREDDPDGSVSKKKAKRLSSTGPPAVSGIASQFLTFFSEGSPTYKQRRKKGMKGAGPSGLRKELGDDHGLDGSSSAGESYERGRTMDPSSGPSSRYSSVHSRESSHSRSQSFSSSSSTHGLPLHMSASGSNPSFHHDPYRTLAPGLHPQPMPMLMDPDGFAERFIADGRDIEMMQGNGRPGSSGGITRSQRPQSMAIGADAGYHSDAGGQQYRYPHSHLRGRSLDLAMGIPTSTRHESLPRGEPNGTNPSYSDTAPLSQSAPQASLTPPGALGSSGMAQYESVSSDGKVRAFVCPLYSCGRLFKRMEHLKRHMRTHTMERPFLCSRCGKRFSRGDNLTQHVRTHERIVPGMDVSSVGAEAMGEDPSMGINVAGGENSSGVVESDEEGYLGAYQQSTPPSMDVYPGGINPSDNNMMLPTTVAGAMDISSFNFGDNANGAINYALLANHNCEVEIAASGVQDVHGDEEGLLMRTVDDPGMVYRVPSQAGSSTESYFTGIPSAPASAASTSTTTSGLFSATATDFASDPSSASSQWPQATPSSSFNSTLGETSANASPFSNSMLMQHHPHRNMSLRSLSTHSSNSYGTTASGGNGSMDGYSASAPSHKQSFDHPTMYTFDDGSITGDIGPARRHRSVTPSIVRAGGAGSGPSGGGNGGRRPMTSGGSEFGSPASVHSTLSSASASGRGYHPYASYNNSANNSRAGSTTNSPQVLSTPLRSDSRASNYSSHGASGLHEQMRQLMSMNPGNSNTGEEGMIMRTESPQIFAYQTDSPSHFNVDLPSGMNVHQSPHVGFIAPMPVHSTTLPDSARGPFDGFYPHQHATL